MIPFKEKSEIRKRALSILGTYNSTTDKSKNNLFYFRALKYIMRSNKQLL